MIRALAFALTLSAYLGSAQTSAAQGKRALSVRESFEPAPEFGGSVHVLEAGPAGAAPFLMRADSNDH